MQHTITMFYYSFTSKCNSKDTAKSHTAPFLYFYLIFLFVLYLVNRYFFTYQQYTLYVLHWWVYLNKIINFAIAEYDT